MKRRGLLVRRFKDRVWYLCGDGFVRGYIKRVFYSEEAISDEGVIYYVTDDIEGPFMGHKKPEKEVFDSYQEAVEYFRPVEQLNG